MYFLSKTAFWAWWSMVHMRFEGCCKICLIRSETEFLFSPDRVECYPHTLFIARLCAYMQICIITHPSENHTGIYTQSPQVTSPLISSHTCWSVEEHGRAATLAFSKREIVTYHGLIVV